MLNLQRGLRLTDRIQPARPQGQLGREVIATAVRPNRPGPDWNSHRTQNARTGANVERRPKPATRLGKLLARIGPALRTVKGAILTAGALAVALGAIWALVPSHKPAEVRFLSVDVLPAPVLLSQFRPTEGKFALTAHNTGPQRRFDAIVSVMQTGQAAPSTTSPAEPTTTPAEPTTETTSTIPTTGSTGPTTTTTPTSRERIGEQGFAPLPRPYVLDVMRRVRSAGLTVESPEGDQWQRQLIARLVGNQTDPNGQLVPAQVAAERVIKKLSHVRARVKGGKEEPVGVVLLVRMKLLNANDVPVQIYWEIAGAGSVTESLTEEWLGTTAAYRLRASEDEDTGSFKLWIPLPREKGVYIASLYARTTSDGLPEDSISTKEFQ